MAWQAGFWQEKNTIKKSLKKICNSIISLIYYYLSLLNGNDDNEANEVVQIG